MPKQSHFKDEIASSGFRPPRNDKLKEKEEIITKGLHNDIGKEGNPQGLYEPPGYKLKEKEKTLHFAQNDDAGLSAFSLSIVISTF